MEQQTIGHRHSNRSKEVGGLIKTNKIRALPDELLFWYEVCSI